MDRATAFPLEETTELDILNTNKFAMVGLGKLALAIIGTGPALHGLACTPGTGLTVQVSAGQIYLVEPTDATAYSSLGTDARNLVKQGLMLDPVTLNCPAPTVTGQSVNYLIQVGYQDVDTGATILPFYNASNPTVPFSGPGGSGAAVSTIRSGQCVTQVKAGAPATAGAQTTPAPDTGFVAAYSVTVAKGATSIVSGNISTIASAPFIAGLLNSHHGGVPGQAPKINLATETQGVLPLASIPTGMTVWCGTTAGTANAQTVATPAAVLTFPPGSGIAFEIGAGLTNTGAMTLTVGSVGTFPVLKDGPSPTGPIPLTGGEVVAGNDMTARLNAAGTALHLTTTELGTAALANASSNTGTVAAVNGSTTANNLAVFGDGVGTVKNGPAISSATGIVSAVSGSTAVGHIAVFSDTHGTTQDGGPAGVAASATPITFAMSGITLGPGVYLVDTSGGPISVNLISSPGTGASWDFTDQKGTMGTNNFSVAAPVGITFLVNGLTFNTLNADVSGYDFLVSYDGNHFGAI